MEDNYYASVDNQKMYINYFDALYLLNIVFKKNKEYEFIDKSHIESIWNSIDYKYHKFCVIKGFEYELGGYEVQIGDEYKGVCEKLIPKENSNNTYNPLTFDENPDFKKSYWKRRDNALNAFTEGDENRNFEKGKFEIVHMPNMTIGRATYKPGWKWSKDVSHLSGTKFCEVKHLGMVIQGKATAQFEGEDPIVMNVGDIYYV